MQTYPHIGCACFAWPFPTGRDSATFRDKGTEVPSLSRDKGTTGQALKPCHGMGQDFDSLSRPETSRGTEMKEKAFKKWDFSLIILHHPVLEHTFSVLESPFPDLELLFLF